MPVLEQDDSIRQYYEQIKDKYPDLTFDQIRDMCKASFWFIKTQIERDDLPIIMVKYFGKFRVTKAKIKEMIDKNIMQRMYERVTQEEYEARDLFLKQKLQDLLDDTEEEDSETD